MIKLDRIACTVKLGYAAGALGGPRETRGEEKLDEQTGTAQNSRREIGERSTGAGLVTVSRTCPAAHIHVQSTVPCVALL